MKEVINFLTTGEIPPLIFISHCAVDNNNSDPVLFLWRMAFLKAVKSKFRKLMTLKSNIITPLTLTCCYKYGREEEQITDVPDLETLCLSIESSSLINSFTFIQSYLKC